MLFVITVAYHQTNSVCDSSRLSAAPLLLNRQAPSRRNARPPPLFACKWEENKLHYEARALGVEGLTIGHGEVRGLKKK